jgi:SPX domain protein involved in polyphosphate accumulation
VFYYIDYDGLKDALRVHHIWDEKSEQSFIEELEKELDKVYTFQRVKAEEIIRRRPPAATLRTTLTFSRRT